MDQSRWGLCWNHTATRTKQGSVGVIWAQQERSCGRGQQSGGGKGAVGDRERGGEGEERVGNVWVGIAVKVLIVS